MPNESKNQFYIEIVRVSAILLSAILAMMTFMLIVGVQNPDKNIKTLMYGTFISLGVSLIVGVAGNVLSERAATHMVGPGRTKAKGLKSRSERMAKLLPVFRLLQQAVFVISIVFVVLLALAVVQFLYKPVPSPSSSQQPGASSQQPSAGESAEEHAQEGSAQQQPASPAPAQ